MKLTMKQKIESLLVMRDKSKSDLESETGISSRKIRRLPELMTCEDLDALARCLGANVFVVLRLPDGKTMEAPLASKSGEVTVASAMAFGELMGGEAEIEFELADLGRRV